MPLIQMHHQYLKDGYRTEIVDQKEINSNEELREWSRSVNASHPLPDGAIWLWCTEGVNEFVYVDISQPLDLTAKNSSKSA